ncbi:MAG: hypothetical protein NZM38_08905 [Cytophagales bacterium]|nr:hypothetical protein [Cytophagales bacterium]MDW8384878.1 hypothetical protein [Flammeovirgaceae bacterium]
MPKKVMNCCHNQLILKTDINFDSEEAVQRLREEGFTGRKIWIAPEPAMAGNPSMYVPGQKKQFVVFFLAVSTQKRVLCVFSSTGKEYGGVYFRRLLGGL